MEEVEDRLRLLTIVKLPGSRWQLTKDHVVTVNYVEINFHLVGYYIVQYIGQSSLETGSKHKRDQYCSYK